MSGRIRTIKPEVLDDERAVALSDSAWRMWISLRCVADDFGNGRFGDRYLAATVWQDTTRSVASEREELVAAGKVLAYEVDGQRYFHLVGWEREQRIDNAGKARVPGPEAVTTTSDQSLAPLFAANLGESPRAAAVLGGSPLDLRSPTPTPTTDQDPADVAEPPPAAAPPALTGAVAEVWAHYVAAVTRIRPRRKPILTDKDRRAIRKHLAAGLTAADLCEAIDGLVISPHHTGHNDTATDYLELRYALREPSRFIAKAQNADPPVRPSAIVRSLPTVATVEPRLIDDAIARAMNGTRGSA